MFLRMYCGLLIRDQCKYEPKRLNPIKAINPGQSIGFHDIPIKYKPVALPTPKPMMAKVIIPTIM